jgi:hypothetical protein
MSSTRVKLIVAVATLAIVALAAGLTLWLTSGGSKAPLSHAEYANLYNEAVVGQTRISVVATWPKPPYQDYHDGNGNHCLEWFDRASVSAGVLYDLCFDKSGVLATKQTP